MVVAAGQRTATSRSAARYGAQDAVIPILNSTLPPPQLLPMTRSRSDTGKAVDRPGMPAISKGSKRRSNYHAIFWERAYWRDHSQVVGALCASRTLQRQTERMRDLERLQPPQSRCKGAVRKGRELPFAAAASKLIFSAPPSGIAGGRTEFDRNPSGAADTTSAPSERQKR